MTNYVAENERVVKVSINKLLVAIETRTLLIFDSNNFGHLGSGIKEELGSIIPV